MTIITNCDILVCNICGKVVDYREVSHGADDDTDWGCGYAQCSDCVKKAILKK